MPPRKQHLKSRNGCIQCKRRKIKCDERLPLCGPCNKHRISCSFEGTTLSSATPPARHNSPPPDLQYAPPITPSSLLDLELLHNFTSRTYCTVSSSLVLSLEQKEFYRAGFVQVAFKYDYFIHALLAASGFHIVYLMQRNLIPPSQTSQPLETYLIAAHTHHNTALRSFRSTLYNVTPENCSAVFGCAALITLMSLAQPPYPDPAASSIISESPRTVSSLVLDWFRLLRGIEPAYQMYIELVHSGPLAPIFSSKVDYGKGPVDPEISSHLDSLCFAFSQHSTTNIRRICNNAISVLKTAFAGVGERRETSAGLGWLVSVDEEFVRLLEGNCQEALVVLGWFCVLLDELRDMWWAEGWAVKILNGVEGLLDEFWVEWVRWPCEAVRGKENESGESGCKLDENGGNGVEVGVVDLGYDGLLDPQL